ncbi:MAG: hypothetical protein ACJ71F_18485 [Nitrososphaeraceae archaeon]
MTFTNLVPHRSILSPLLLGLESLGIFIKHLDYMNGNRELYRLAENLKQEFMNEIMETKEQVFLLTLTGTMRAKDTTAPYYSVMARTFLLTAILNILWRKNSEKKGRYRV